MTGAHSVAAAWDGARLVGLGYTISDGHLVVSYTHLLVAPAYQRRGVGTAIMRELMARYERFHLQSVIADRHSVPFYAKLGFVRAGQTESMWIYQGTEH